MQEYDSFIKRLQNIPTVEVAFERFKLVTCAVDKQPAAMVVNCLLFTRPTLTLNNQYLLLKTVILNHGGHSF